ncbi:hypothetical protein Tco_1009827 [Tanacetum coccineum]
MVISSPCLTDIKNWLVQSKRLLLASPKQTALGKDFSNPLMVDSLPKTIWLSMHHVIAMKHWLFQSKRLLSQKSSSSSKSRLKNNYVFGYILQVIKKLKLKKYEVSTASTSVSTGSKVSTISISLDLSRLATTLNRLERSIQIGINISQFGIQLVEQAVIQENLLERPSEIPVRSVRPQVASPLTYPHSS